jgi:hypothetical protein
VNATRKPAENLPLDLPAAYDGGNFARRDDGSYVCEGDGSPPILDCNGYGPSHLLHVDQDGMAILTPTAWLPCRTSN